MDTTLPAHRITQALGLAGSLWLSGNIASLSLITTPALSTSQERDSVPPGVLCKQWKYVYDNGHDQNIPLIGTVSACLAYSAWAASRTAGLGVMRQGGGLLWVASTVSTLSIVPFTIIFMTSTNDRLHALANEAIRTKDDKAASASEVGRLIMSWTRLNAMRSLLPLAGGILAILAAGL